MQYLGAISKITDDLCSFPRQIILYYSNSSLCPNHYAEEAVLERFYEDKQDILELTQKKKNSVST